MTEAEWRTCEEPTDMLLFIKQRRTIRKQAKRRKQKLFSIACCRRIWPLITDDGRDCVEVAERDADNQVTTEELTAATVKANSIWLKDAADGARFACNQLFWDDVNGLHVSASTIDAAFKRQQAETNTPFEPLAGRTRGAHPSEARAQCALIRDIFGDPFRPIKFTPAWRTDTAVALARGMYESRDFGAMPILADALQDAGCDNHDLLNHCRDDEAHVRGCWVVDLVLGKA